MLRDVQEGLVDRELLHAVGNGVQPCHDGA